MCVSVYVLDCVRTMTCACVVYKWVSMRSYILGLRSVFTSVSLCVCVYMDSCVVFALSMCVCLRAWESLFLLREADNFLLYFCMKTPSGLRFMPFVN